MMSRDPDVLHAVETICALGCSRVNQIIERLERGDPLAETSGLAAEQRSVVLAELREIMAVYEVPCDLPEHTGDGPASLARKPAGSDQNHRRRLSEIERDEEGFLLDVHDWYPELADEIAAEADQPLTQEHREIIAYIREHFERNDSVPEARTLLKHLAENWGPERATRRYLYALFPRGYGQVACKIAGMRKPRKLMLDV